jgi:hypothetical protein
MLKRGPSPLVISGRIMKAEFFTNSILRNVLLPFVQESFPNGHRFQQDDTKHTSKPPKEFIAGNDVNWWREWSSESPDQNLIEMVWKHMESYIGVQGPRTKVEH